MRTFALFVAGLPVLSVAFAPSNKPVITSPTHMKRQPSASTFLLHASPVAVDPIDASRFQFFFWFFGASGAAGLARSSFPRMFDAVREIQSLKGVGPTKGGETLSLSPICGYPQDLSVEDVKQIVNNPLSVEELVEKYPIEGNFLSAKGYLTYAAFQASNADANPLAVRAVFDTFATSTNVVDPNKAQALIDSYKEDVNEVANQLLRSKLLGYFAIVTLLFLLGLADVIAAGHAYHGWFPDWPGAKGWPASWFNPETALWTIPQYWI